MQHIFTPNAECNNCGTVCNAINSTNSRITKVETQFENRVEKIEVSLESVKAQLIKIMSIGTVAYTLAGILIQVYFKAH